MQYRSIRIGRFYGIELRLDYSWFIIFVIIAWSLTAGVLPAVYKDLSTAETVVTGLVATVLLFLSVVVHEFAHSIYAKKSGLAINRITLFIFGGASELEDEPRNPRQEFILAGLGPLTSLIVGLVFWLVWLVGRSIDYTPLAAIGWIVGNANIALAIFNLIPGFPLDGGRMFRAIIWKTSGDLLKATRTAATVGKVFAVLLVVYGLLQLLLTGILGSLWLILVGIFLYGAASVGYMQTRARLLLKDVRVSEVMSKNHITEPSDTEARDFMRGKESDKNGQQVLHPEDPAIKAINIIANSTMQQVAVVKNNKIVGILSLENLQSYLLGKRKLRGE